MPDLFQKPLYEKYRPACWAEVVGQPKVVATIQRLIARGGLAGKAYWIAGASGTGKSSIAKLLALEVADDFCVEELDASALTVSALRELEKAMQVSGWGEKRGRAVIVNEAHGLRKDVIRQLLVTLERIPSHCAWIFTTTNENEEQLFEDYSDASPLLSRCFRLDLARRDLAKAFAQRAMEIALAENLDGRPFEQYLRLVQTHRNNMRSVLNAIESGAMQD
jgi:DNA polymerase III gamma/tau subunit